MTKKKVLGANTIQVPLWMWTFSVVKHRYVPTARRPGLQAKNERLFFKNVVLLRGFSHSPRLSFRTGGKAELAVQKRRLSKLSAEKARLPATWEALAHKFPTPVAIRVHVQRGQNGRFWLLLADSKGPLAYLERSIDFADGVVEHKFMTRNPKRDGDGKGIGDQAMANASVVYPALGISRIELTAGLSSGSAVWPRLGFSPVNLEEWDNLRKVVLANFRALHPDVTAMFALVHRRPLQAAVASIVANDDPAAVFEVVDIDHGFKVGSVEFQVGCGA
jgi:hypothetical protein